MTLEILLCLALLGDTGKLVKNDILPAGAIWK